MTVHRRPSKARKKYRPPATGMPKTAVVLLIRSGKVLTVLSRYHAAKNEWEEPGAKIGTGETVRAAACSVLTLVFDGGETASNRFLFIG